MPTPDSPEKSPNYDELSFEEAMEELESLVRGADSDRLPLAEMITGYEKGTQLYQLCRKRLDEARGRIELIRKSADETAELEVFGEPESAANKLAPSTAASKRTPMPAPEGAGDDDSEENDDDLLNFKDGELF